MESLENVRERFDALEQQMAPLPQQSHAREAHLQAREAETPTEEWRRQWAVRAVLLSVATLLGAIGIALGSMTPAHADVIQCGDVLGPGGWFELEHDLDCGDRAVTVRDGAVLDLNGHIVACRSGSIRCIVLTGIGAQLLNGAVDGGLHESIFPGGGGKHTMRNVTSTLVDANVIVLQSDHNQLINVMAESIFNPAFVIVGNHNRLTGNIARCFELAFGACIEIRGNGNHLIDNFATSTSVGSGEAGFMITGDNNVLRGNRAIRNEGPGIAVTGTGNILLRNTALENTLDLQDTSGDCTQNTWRQNTFRTSDPACIDDSAGGSVAKLKR